MKQLWMGTLALAALTAQAATGATLIDDFGLPGVGQIIQILPSSNPQVVVTPLTGGTTRTATFTVTSNPVNMFDLMGGIGGGALVLAFSPTAGVAGNVTLDYAFGSTLDFSAEQFVEVVSTGSAFGASFTIVTSTGNLVLNTTLSGGPTNPKNFWLSSFSGTGNLAQVTAFRAVFSGVSSDSLSVDSISVVPTPEPGTALLLVLPALVVIRRRKN